MTPRFRSRMALAAALWVVHVARTYGIVGGPAQPRSAGHFDANCLLQLIAVRNDAVKVTGDTRKEPPKVAVGTAVEVKDHAVKVVKEVKVVVGTAVEVRDQAIKVVEGTKNAAIGTAVEDIEGKSGAAAEIARQTERLGRGANGTQRGEELARAAAHRSDQALQLELDHFDLLNQLRAAGYTCPEGNAYAPNSVPLLWDCRLWKASQLHSQDMADNDYFSHTSQDGRTFVDRGQAQGIFPNAENIAAGVGGAGAVLDQWKASDPHCNNMMNPSRRMFGVGYGSNAAATYTHYWTQMLKIDQVTPDVSCLAQGSDESDVVGDPHVTNIARERFDIRADGEHKLVQIPRLVGSGSAPDLRVDAVIQYLEADSCDKAFVTSLNISGRWTDGPLHITRGSNTNTSLLVNAGEPAAFFNRSHFQLVETGPLSLKFSVQGVGFHVGKHFEGRYGNQKSYLNVRITGLRSHESVGGLLGGDSHEAAERPPAKCTPPRVAAGSTGGSFIGQGRSVPTVRGGSWIVAE